MTNQNDRINELNERLKFLLMRQSDLSAALEKLQQEITLLKSEPVDENAISVPVITEPIINPEIPRTEAPTLNTHFDTPIQRIPKRTNPASLIPTIRTTQSTSTLEKFIGEN